MTAPLRSAALFAVVLLSASPVAAQEVPPADGPAARARLEAVRVSLDLQDQPLEAVVNLLSDLSGVDLVVDPAAYAVRSEAERRVTLRVRGVSARDALRLVCTFQGLRAVWRDGVVLLAPPEQARGGMVVRVHDVRDMLRPLAQFPGPNIELSREERGIVPFFEPKEMAPYDEDELADLVKESCGGDAWEKEGARIQVVNGMLIVRQSAEVQAEIAALLARLRAVL